MNAVKNYFKTSLEELTKITWPTKNQAVRLTIIVLVFCVLIAAFMAGVDYLLNMGSTYLLKVSA
ncbi:MAG: preprotein translocase subunit SecE [bacterium]|nr:preprotein translocase subunit SecE [bacterium]